VQNEQHAIKNIPIANKIPEYTIASSIPILVMYRLSNGIQSKDISAGSASTNPIVPPFMPNSIAILGKKTG
jgi:hypothetical protein